MEDTRNIELINTGRLCPYCFSKTEYVDSIEVYSRSYGMIYLCRPCKAWVGVHKNTDRALGRLADCELRDAKKLAHFYFDSLWKRKMSQGLNKNHARGKAYRWLAGELNIDPELCHIGMFDVEQCNRVIELCKTYYR